MMSNIDSVWQIALACGGIAVFAIMAFVVLKVQSNSYKQFNEIIAADRVHSKDTAFLVAETIGDKLADKVQFGFESQKNEITKLTDSFIEFKKEIEKSSERNQTLNRDEFKRMGLALDKIELILVSEKKLPSHQPGNLNVDLKVSEKLPV